MIQTYGGKHLTDHQLSRSRDSSTIVSEVRVLEQDPRILFMDTNSVLDRLCLASSIYEVCIEISDCALAITA